VNVPLSIGIIAVGILKRTQKIRLFFRWEERQVKFAAGVLNKLPNLEGIVSVIVAEESHFMGRFFI
jgi:hypothetical protein